MRDKGIILYVHGMGGGADSRIPSILKDCFTGGDDPEVVVRTYDFDPETARRQLEEWVAELRPCLLVGESLGAVHTLALRNGLAGNCMPESAGRPAILPAILVSPALNAPALFHRLAFLACIPGVSALLRRIYKPRPGERQKLDFKCKSLRKWGLFRKEALDTRLLSEDDTFAFFGKKDHYRRTGIVSLRSWRRVFGENSYAVYDGTHFMEEEYVKTLLVPKISAVYEQVREGRIGNNGELY